MSFKLFLILCAVYLTSAKTITTQFDNIDIEEILKNNRLYRSYIDCLTKEGKCTPDGKDLREALPDALATNCANCSEAMKKNSGKVLEHIIKNKPQDFEKLEKIYDPDHIYRQKYEKEAKELGLEVEPPKA